MSPGTTGGRSRCAIVIVNYRTADLTRLAVQSALGQIDASLDRIVVVDNASGDDSLDVLRGFAAEEGWGRSVEIVASARNGGFSAGNNLGIESVSADAYLLLNSDATLEEGALAELLRALAQHPDVGIVGPAIRDPAGLRQLSTFRYRTPLSEALESADLGLLRKAFSRHDPILRMDDQVARRDVEWLSFACVLVRREVLERIGPLDEGFFLYFEDLDFCRRAREAGFGLLYWPAASAVHDEGSSSDAPVAVATRSRRPSYYYEARARYFGRYYGRAGLWAANLLRAAGGPVSWLRTRVGGDRAADRGGAKNEWLDVWTCALGPMPALGLEPARRHHTGQGRPFILLDRDGTLVEDHGYTHRIEDYVLLPGVASALKRLAEAGFGLAIVTNQSGIGRGYYTEADFERFQAHLFADLKEQGVTIEASFHCPHTPDANCACRKPAKGLIDKAAVALGVDRNASWVIGDTARDIGASEAAGCAGAVLVLTGEGEATSAEIAASVPRARDLGEAAEFILEQASRDDRLD